MTKTFFHYICAATLLLGASACTSSGADEPTPDGGSPLPCHMSVVLVLADQASGNATPEGDYDAGQGYENYIDLRLPEPDIKLSLFGTDNTYAGDIANPVVTSMDSDGKGSKTYLLEFDLSEEFYNKFNGRSFKLMMLANFNHRFPSAYTTLTAIGDKGRRYTAKDLPGPVLQQEDKIAMYGVSQYDNVAFEAGARISLGKLHLIRALAKVEVFDSEASTMPIQTVELTRHNTLSYSVPEGVLHQNDYVKGNYDDDYIAHVTTDAAYETAGPVPFSYTEIDGKRHYIIYVPEYANLGADGNPRPEAERARLRVSYSDDRIFYVEFRRTDSSPFLDISRNVWYRFALNRKDAQMSVETQVVPYDEKDLNIGFGLNSGLNLVPIMDNNGRVVYYYDPATGDYYGPDRKTKIPNPYINRDPVTGWNLSRDINGRFVCYHDTKNGKFYGWDKKTEILQPTANIDPETGWYTIIRAADNVILYYYDQNASVWYMPDKTTKVEEPFK